MKVGKSLASGCLLLALVLANGGIVAAQEAGHTAIPGTNNTGSADGELLSNPSTPGEGHYWRINDDRKIWYDPILMTQTDEGPIDAPMGTAASCSTSELNNTGCQDQEGVCIWNSGNDRHWYEPDENGEYHDDDFAYGRCAAVLTWTNADGTWIISRGGVRMTAVTNDPACPECGQSVQGEWGFTTYIDWYDNSGNKISRTEVGSGEPCHAPSQLLGNAVYADCRWAALGPSSIEVDRPATAIGYDAVTELSHKETVKEVAQVSCRDCLQ